MTNGVEGQLRDLLIDAEPQIDLPLDELARVAVEGGHVRRRQLRVRAALTCIAAAAVVAATVVAVPRVLDATSLDPASDGSSDVISGQANVYTWARELPRGDDAQLAYVVGHSIRVGAGIVPIGDENYATLVEPVDGGWLAQSGTQDKTYAGVMSVNGVFTRFADQPGGSKGGFSASPNGRQIVLDGALLNAATGRVVGHVPVGAHDIQRWTVAGIAYEDQQGYTNVWQPGGEPRRIGHWKFVSDSIALNYAYDCTNVGRLDATGTMTIYDKACGHDPGVLSISPDGRYVIHTDGTIVDTSSGEHNGHLPFSPINDAGSFDCCRVVWEDDTHIIAIAANAQPGSFQENLLVRCSIDADDCERASDQLKLYPYPIALPKQP